MSTIPPPPRIYGLLARGVPLCVLFRRGPTRQVQVISWNTKSDEFELGQWFKGRIYERRGDLSPDGRYLVYFAAKHKSPDGDWEKGSWTAVSRPPYLTALGLWFKGDCWSGGGLFESNKSLLLNDAGCGHLENRIDQAAPFKVGTLGIGRGEDDPIEAVRLARDGWVTHQEMSVTKSNLMSGYITDMPRIRTKTRSGATLQLSDWIRRYESVEEYAITTEPVLDLSRVRWADWDHHDRIIFARDGCIFAAETTSETWRVKELANLNQNRFEPIAAPEDALKW